RLASPIWDNRPVIDASADAVKMGSCLPKVLQEEGFVLGPQIKRGEDPEVLHLCGGPGADPHFRIVSRRLASSPWGWRMIKTKSVYSPIDRKRDGLRILATRFRGRYMPVNRYDVWMPNLAPSEALMRSTQNGLISWAQFSRKYRKELRELGSIDTRNRVIKNHGQKFTLRLLQKLGRSQNVTLMCHCVEDQEQCHRHLLKELLARKNAVRLPSLARWRLLGFGGKAGRDEASGQKTHVHGPGDNGAAPHGASTALPKTVQPRAICWPICPSGSDHRDPRTFQNHRSEKRACELSL